VKDEPLFADKWDPPSVTPVVFNEKIQWNRIVVLNKPTCGHCQMLIYANIAVPVQRARWTRIGLDGSVLDLCEGHKLLQQALDGP
jgi:hypothetical protein